MQTNLKWLMSQRKIRISCFCVRMQLFTGSDHGVRKADKIFLRQATVDVCQILKNHARRPHTRLAQKNDARPSLKATTGARAFAGTTGRCGRWVRWRSTGSTGRWIRWRSARRVGKHNWCNFDYRGRVQSDAKQLEATRTSDHKCLFAPRIRLLHEDEVQRDQISVGIVQAAYFEHKPSHAKPMHKSLRIRLLQFSRARHGYKMAPFVVFGVRHELDIGSSTMQTNADMIQTWSKHDPDMIQTSFGRHVSGTT